MQIQKQSVITAAENKMTINRKEVSRHEPDIDSSASIWQRDKHE
jgi:hypothetical protein